LQNALFAAVPSRSWEAFGLVVVESYAAGLPVIATRMAGLEDLIQPHETGLLVAPESPHELAAAMRRLFQDPPAARRMGAQARRFAQGFDWRIVAKRHLALYEELLEARHRRAA
jgi:glycogen(starch) synthase